MNHQNIPLGSKVRDTVTGIIGIAIQHVEIFGGTLQVAVQPASTDTREVPEAFNVDIQQVEIVESSLAARASPPQDCEIELGNQVEDVVSGFIGIATSRVTFINGCVWFNIESPPTKGDKPEDRHRFLASARLKVKGVGVAVKATRASKASQKPPGGPTTRAQRMS